ncbi:hypothetical protein RXV86_20815 [Alisedimentitalea sp. MJ-SS2]|uniref:hypothetical protein n=1 Tax=Aliisedimentitalea sp. MJ-SS2 TaxID=3049795 RepID=UPI002913F297|nr:hypothetical protein [Alisedimentitalea sp. MJ-SS2]MDU8929836.1 hypothetical protein [Alisedimentitalea sp. MJ-SS2]
MILSGFRFGQWMAAVTVLFAGLFLFADQAYAHGTHDASPPAAAEQSLEEAHAESGHPGHCHGGTFCSGVAVMIAAYSAPQLSAPTARAVISSPVLRALSITLYDPPPPRVLS